MGELFDKASYDIRAVAGESLLRITFVAVGGAPAIRRFLVTMLPVVAAMNGFTRNQLREDL